MMRRTLPIVALLLCTATAWAQSPADEQPAVSTSNGTAATEDLPAVETTAPAADKTATGKAATGAKTASPTNAASPASGGKNNEGTTIIGERESPIGLYITPWHNAAAESDIDRPARLLSVGLEVLDRRVFARQVEYYQALTAAEKAKATGTSPTDPSSKPAP